MFQWKKEKKKKKLQKNKDHGMAIQWPQKMREAHYGMCIHTTQNSVQACHVMACMYMPLGGKGLISIYDLTWFPFFLKFWENVFSTNINTVFVIIVIMNIFMLWKT